MQTLSMRLGNMNRRAQQLSVRLSVESSEHGTKLRLEIGVIDCDTRNPT
jgi:signal transduction histidine kinase